MLEGPPAVDELLLAQAGLACVQSTEAPPADVVPEDSEAEHHVILDSGKVNEIMGTYDYKARSDLQTVLVILVERQGQHGHPFNHALEALEHALEHEKRLGEDAAVDDYPHAEDHTGIFHSGVGNIELKVVHEGDHLCQIHERLLVDG